MKCPRGRPKPGKCSAHQIVVIRCVEQKVRNENLSWVKSKNRQKIDFKKGFVQSEQKQQKMTPVTLQAPKIFSTGPNNTYEVF